MPVSTVVSTLAGIAIAVFGAPPVTMFFAICLLLAYGSVAQTAESRRRDRLHR